jgi:hypothetical protein
MTPWRIPRSIPRRIPRSTAMQDTFKGYMPRTPWWTPLEDTLGGQPKEHLGEDTLTDTPENAPEDISGTHP